jgi:hypothetical protein
MVLRTFMSDNSSSAHYRRKTPRSTGSNTSEMYFRIMLVSLSFATIGIAYFIISTGILSET